MTTPQLTGEQAETFARCMAVGGVAVFPSDTVYGLACDPSQREAVSRLYGLKQRPLQSPSAVMFFSLELAMDAIVELGPKTRFALEQLLPGPLTVLLSNPAGRYPLACGSEPATLGLRVPALSPQLAALGELKWPILQSSANRAGEPAPTSIAQLDPALRGEVDLVLDGGQLGDLSSSVLDLREYESEGRWELLREGPLGSDQIEALLGRKS
jgi:L-threonylcarbamoyladenylate synthase